MRAGLAEAWCARVCDEGPEHPDALAAAHNLGQVRAHDGNYAEAERIHRDILAVRRRVLGDEHPLTLSSAHEIAFIALGPMEAR